MEAHGWKASTEQKLQAPLIEAKGYFRVRSGFPNPVCSSEAVDQVWDKDCSFGNPHICHRIYTDLNADSTTFGPNGEEEAIGIRLRQDSETASTDNAFFVWTETDNSPFYCVEP
jgi:hypothetical protein